MSYPIWFCKNTRKQHESEFKKLRSLCEAERDKKYADEAKRRQAAASRLASELKDISV